MKMALLAFIALFTFSFLLGGRPTGNVTAADKDKDAKAAQKDPVKVDKQALKKLMVRKMDSSQRLLKALVMNNLDDAAAEAEELKKVRKDALWLIKLKGREEEYDIWSKDFTRSADKVLKAAKERNAEAAKMGYLEMTHSCFGCHSYVRDYADIRFEDQER